MAQTNVEDTETTIVYSPKKQNALPEENYKAVANNTLSVFDRFLTFFRYNRLIRREILGDHNTQGDLIDFSSKSPSFAIGVSAIFSFAAMIQLVNSIRKTKRKDARYSIEESDRYILNSLDSSHKDNGIKAVSILLQQEIEVKAVLDSLKNELEINAFLQKHKKKKYMHMGYSYSADGGQYIIKVKPPMNQELKAKEKIKAQGGFASYIESFGRFVGNYGKPIYNALAISAFAYWILWISTAVFTGVLDVGIVGLPSIIGFGVPFALGAFYLGLKLYNALVGNKEVVSKEQVQIDEHLKKEAVDDLNYLLACYLIQTKFNELKNLCNQVALGEEPSAMIEKNTNLAAIQAKSPLENKIGMEAKVKKLDEKAPFYKNSFVLHKIILKP